MSKIILAVIVLAITFVAVSPQTKKRRQIPPIAPKDISGPVAIVFGERKDGLPEKLTIKGTITDLTFADSGCGGIAWSGTLKVKLSEPIPEYHFADVFLVLSCFPEFEQFKKREQYIGRPVSLTVSKLYPDYRFGAIKDIDKVPCAFEIIVNELDSNKVPFYCTEESISKSIEATERSREKP